MNYDLDQGHSTCSSRTKCCRQRSDVLPTEILEMRKRLLTQIYEYINRYCLQSKQNVETILKTYEQFIC